MKLFQFANLKMRLLIIAVSPLLLSVFLNLKLYVDANRTNDVVETYSNKILPLTQYSGELQSSLNGMFRYLWAMSATKGDRRTQSMKLYEDTLAHYEKVWSDFQQLPNSESAKSKIQEVASAWPESKQTFEQIKELLTHNDPLDDKEAVVLIISKLRVKVTVLEKAFAEMDSIRISDTKQEAQKMLEDSRTQLQFIKFAVPLLILILLGFILKLATSLSGQISDISKKLVIAAEGTHVISEKMGQASTTLAKSSQEQAAAIQESVSSLSEMSSMISHTRQNVKLSFDNTKEAQEQSLEGQHTMEKLAHSMESIQNANSQLQEISVVIENISQKTNVINDIVFKTQLLSFNASIEAARAGQYGRGFAVVAEEVGKLADISGNAAKEIKALLEGSQTKVRETLEMIKSRVSEGNSISADALKIFSGIATKIDEINHQVKSIEEASHQQVLGINETNKAMGQIDTHASANNTASNDTFQTSNLLKKEARGLRDVIGELQILVTGKSSNETHQKTQTHTAAGSSSSLVFYNTEAKENLNQSNDSLNEAQTMAQQILMQSQSNSQTQSASGQVHSQTLNHDSNLVELSADSELFKKVI